MRTDYPDGSSEHFSYDHAGQLSVLTDAEGNRTAYDYDNDNKPTIRYNALGDAFQYRYDLAGRLKTLVNENGDSYTFEYDERDRLIRETGFDGKMTRYTYNPAGELIREEEYASGNIDVRTRPLRTTIYHRDRIGRIRQKDSHLDGGEILSTHYRYDKLNRLIQAHNAHSELRFSYDHNRLVKEQLIHLDSPIVSGTSRSQSKDVAAQITEHRYDVLGNRIQTILPTGEVLNRLYYGSGHLHHINLDGTTLADIERDALHRPIERTVGKLNTQFQLDPLGRLKQQIAQPNGHNKADPAVLIGRSYQYDTIGNLICTDDQTNGSRDYTYDALGRITQSADEHYRYDPAHNLTDESRIGGNRLTQYKGTSYRYDPLGNLIEKQHNNGEIHHYRYNADNQLTEAEIHHPGQNAVLYRYRYDPMGRRIAKVHPDGNEIQYLWDGSRLLQEYRKDRTYTYVYTEDRNYEPLAQITTYNGSDKAREILYYHNDQIGIPREMTDEKGNIVWSGDYSGWGKLTQESRLKLDIHQPFRLQNQYYDEETGLHYNFFRYYDPEIGRFTQQDPIGLLGGDNLYRFGNSAQGWIDLLGLEGKTALQRIDETLTGVYVEGSATAGLGLAASCSYAGKGKVSCNIALTAGASLEAGAGISKTVSERKDGAYTEICATAKPGFSVGVCGGSNLNRNATPYGSGKVGVGAGAGVTANIGYQKTFDLLALLPKAQPQYLPRKIELPPGMEPNKMHPDQIFNNIRF